MKVSYGSRTNRYLTVWYGFSLLNNCYDSFTFCFVVDEKVAKSANLTHNVLRHWFTREERKKGFIIIEGTVIPSELITVPFVAKMHELAHDLILYLRAHMY